MHIFVSQNRIITIINSQPKTNIFVSYLQCIDLCWKFMLACTRYYSACLFHLNQVVKIMPFQIPTDPIQTSKNFFLINWCGRIFYTKAKYNYVSHDSEKIQWSKKDIFYQPLSSQRKIIFLTIYLTMQALLIIIFHNYND